MIDTITGTIQHHTPTYISLYTPSGVGYKIHVNQHTQQQISNAETNTSITLYVSPIIREQSHTLWGFTTRDDRDMFDALCSIRGVGPGIAANMLHEGKDVLIEHIQSNNVNAITKYPKVGAKIAQTIIQERNKLPIPRARTTARNNTATPAPLATANTDNTPYATNVLQFLQCQGTNKNLAMRAAQHVYHLPASEQIAAALRYVATQ